MKRFFKYAIAAMAAMTLAGFAVSCGSDDDDKNEVEITTPKGTDISVKVGETVTAEVAVRPAGTTLSWSSADETKATVKDGKITGVAEGKTTVTATAKGKSVTFNVTVTEKDNGGQQGGGTPNFIPQDTEFPILSINPNDIVDDIVAHEKVAGRVLTKGLELGFGQPVEAFVGNCEHINVVMYGVVWNTSKSQNIGMIAGANGDRMTVLKPYFDKVLTGWEYYGEQEDKICAWISQDGWQIILTDTKGGQDSYAYEHEVQIVSNTLAQQSATKALTVRKAYNIKPLQSNLKMVVRR